MTHCESGRTLVETLATLAVIGVLSVGAVKLYHHVTTKVKAQNTAKMIKTLAFERQNTAMRDSTEAEMTVKGPHSSLLVKNGTTGNHQPYFWVETSLSDSAFCEALKESELIQADLIEVDDVANGNCTDNSKIAFYFKKNATASVYCPDHSTNCTEFGDATGCEDGYYLDNGTCSACGAHVATCEDANTPLTCEEGYELHWGQCITPPQMCRMDSDCDVCATCDTETGYCQGECEIPTPDANQDCGENECVVYDEETQSCRYVCERKEYLEKIDGYIQVSGSVTDDGVSNRRVTYDSTYSFPNVVSRQTMGYGGATTNHYFGVNSTHSEIGTTNTGINTNVALEPRSVYTFRTKFQSKGTANTELWVYQDGELLPNGYNQNNAYLGAERSDYYIFRAQWSGGYCLNGTRFYGAKIWFDDVLVGELIPCIRKSDNTVGVYNKADKTFTASTGSVIAG